MHRRPIADELTGFEEAVVELVTHDGRVWGLYSADGEVSSHEIGSAADLAREMKSLRFNLRLLTRGRGDLSRVREIARDVDARLFRWLPGDERPLVVVPNTTLFSMPWSVLPISTRVAITVAPSARTWARVRSTRAVGLGGPIVAVAGPDLDHADSEVAQLARLVGEVEVIDSSRSATETVLAEMEGASVVHFACHATFRRGNPMFSSLRMADGDLHVYDIEKLKHPPRVVVFSACDSGFSEADPGEELLGLTSALLSLGSESVIASVGLIPDTAATTGLMLSLHGHLNSGTGPAKALFLSGRDVGESVPNQMAAANFICVGAG